MSYRPAIIANALLYRARQVGMQLDHMKLQKLVFLVHAWSLALHDQPAVDRPPEAWTYGPVFSDLYNDLRGNGREPVTNLIPTFDEVANKMQPFIPSEADTAIWSVINQVMDRYGKLTALQLSTLSHEPGGPWETAKMNRQSMTDGLIKDHYRRKLESGVG